MIAVDLLVGCLERVSVERSVCHPEQSEGSSTKLAARFFAPVRMTLQLTEARSNIACP